MTDAWEGKADKIRLLHLEDSALDGDLVSEYLRLSDLEFEVHRVWTRDDYIESIETDAFDLVLADHHLPTFDGHAALELLRARDADIPFIFVSGTLGEEVAIEALKRGATDYVLKQRLHRLPNAVERALKEAADRRKRRRAEFELRRLNADLERQVEERTAELVQMQKIESIGQLTGGVAHDFNNLLTPIMSTLDLLRRRHAGDERAERMIAGALQAAERAKTLVQRLLAFARRQHLDTKSVDIGALFQGLSELIVRSLGPQISVVIVADPALPLAQVDPHQLELALLNLAVNARDAMPNGGELRIEGREVVVDARSGNGLAPGLYVQLSVTDNGLGMDAETLKRCIEPFFSTKGVGKGTGLGLSMVHGLAAQSGGALQITSTPGIGTRADLLIPASHDRPPADAPAGAEATIASPPLRILLVDDEELVRAATANLIAELGHTVLQAPSTARALQMLGTDAFDVLVTDYAMPGMTGVELAAEARRLRPGLPILLITGYANVAEATDADLPRIAKPFRQADIALRLAQLTQRRGG